MNDDTIWGNPANKSFTVSTIREAKQGDLTVKVHKTLKPLVERLLADLDVLHAKIEVATNEKDKLGKSFQLTGKLTDEQAALIDVWGFELADGVVSFVAKYEWAVAKAREFHDSDVAEVFEVFAPEPMEGNRPGSRELSNGDTGKDVEWLQLFLGIEATGTYDGLTELYVKAYQLTMGLEQTGEADKRWWEAILPVRVRWRRQGEAGRDVRMIESALIAFGYQPGPVQGRFGIVMSRALRQLRADKGMNGNPKIDRMTWEVLFDFQYAAVPTVAV
jgi:peptidoglycan hydrolase-like protein with peptidoglycan-binding domain